MIRESLIRRLPEIAFAVLFGGGLWLGGDAAVAGLPKVLAAMAPDMAAQAGVEDTSHDRVRLAVPQGFTESRFPPQPLYPVTAAPLPAWLTRAMRDAKPPPRGDTAPRRPVIAICIDDLGEDLAGTGKALGLPKEVALAFLPFAGSTPFLAETAARRGHLVLAHVPMQALDGRDPGAMGLKPEMTQDEIARRLGWNLSRVPGLVGINNHEGSRFTADAAALAPVMAALKARHLFFFDSRTGPQSAVRATAQAAGVMTGARDVFLDDDPRAPAVSAALEMLAREARRNGAAIAIGHPHDVTLRLLAAWLAEDHGVTLVPLDEAIRLKAQRAMALAAR
ncbi:MAG TPA: divergent polysaccharide deacetylase family protein [Rhizomicrobium sp.]|nr:divergent polysaccharide deacetylase family protein [Rhizomicrobium sp.]